MTHDHDEAFTIADRMAVMLAGRVVQEGTTAEVWRAPATREVAEFIGFETFLESAAAEACVGRDRAPDDGMVLALRRSALRVDPDGRLAGVVRRGVAVSDAVHLTVDVDGVGRVEALVEALEDAGVDPSTYDRDKPPPGLTDDEKTAIDADAGELTTPSTVQATQGVQQQALDVCKTPLSF